MRHIPNKKYKGLPCSYVSTGCAYENLTGETFKAKLPVGLKGDWATLKLLNEYVRQHLTVKKKVYYKQSERFKLREFLADNKENAVVCVLGHSIYVKGNEYWSFFDNHNDDVVCIWFLK